MELLADLEEASQKISLNQRIDPKLLEILIPATTMGGARPKVTLQDICRDWQDPALARQSLVCGHRTAVPAHCFQCVHGEYR